MTLTTLNRFIVLVLNGSFVLTACAILFLAQLYDKKPTALLEELSKQAGSDHLAVVVVILAFPLTAAALIISLAIDGLAALTARALITQTLKADGPSRIWTIRLFACWQDWIQYRYYLELCRQSINMPAAVPVLVLPGPMHLRKRKRAPHGLP